MKKIIIFTLAMLLMVSSVFALSASRSINGNNVAVNIYSGGSSGTILEETVPCSVSTSTNGCQYAGGKIRCVFLDNQDHTANYISSCSSGSISGQVCSSGNCNTVSGNSQLGSSNPTTPTTTPTTPTTTPTTLAGCTVSNPQSTTSCYNGNLYYYDNCGGLASMKQSCTYGCASGVCSTIPEPKPGSTCTNFWQDPKNACQDYWVTYPWLLLVGLFGGFMILKSVMK